MAAVDWMGKNAPRNPSIIRDAGHSFFNEARGQFFNTFATNSKASMLFAQSPSDVFETAFSRTIPEGSPKHIRNLERAAKLYPDNPKIRQQINTLSKSAGRAGSKAGSLFSKIPIAGAAIGLGFMGYAAYSTPGGVYEKSLAAGATGAGMIAGTAGMWAGAVGGAAIGSTILPGIGSLIGGVAGGLAGSMGADMAASGAVYAVAGVADRMVQGERNRRTWDWVGSTAAFNTQKAATMRQQSLSAMNRGSMSSRSLLGKEAMYVHR